MKSGPIWAIAWGGLALVLAAESVVHLRRDAAPPKTHEPRHSTSRQAEAPGSAKRSAAPSPSGSPSPTTLDMVSPTTGWAASPTQVWWTDDGGASWASVTPPGLPSGSTLILQALSADTAWVGESGNLADAGPYPVFLTTTHGQSWQKAEVPESSQAIGALSMLSAKEGFIATDMAGAMGSESMVVEETANGGSTWVTLPSSYSSTMAQTGAKPASPHPIPFGGDKSGMTWTSTEDGWITGGIAGSAHENAVVLKTRDGGADWYPVSLPAADGAPDWALPPQFFGQLRGIMAVQVDNAELSIYRTSNSGTSWTAGQPLPWPGGGSLWSFANAEAGMAIMMQGGTGDVVNGATLYRTANQGASWTPVPTNLSLTSVDALDLVTSETGFAMTSRAMSVLWETTDGGAYWHRVAGS